MRFDLSEIASLLRGNARAARVVPSTGFSSRLVMFTAAAMTFLAVIALAFSLSASRIAADWTSELSASLTVRISAPLEQIEAQTEAALKVLRTTPGIKAADVVSRDEQSALLTPWLGTTLDLETFDLPQLIAVETDGAGPDREGLLLRFSAEAPGATLDDHGRWREPLIASANQIRNLGILALVLVLTVTAVVTVLAVQSTLVSNGRNISTLRLIGAHDGFIVRAFVRRITLYTLAGAAAGCVLGLLVVWLQPSGGDLGQGLSFGRSGWVLALLLVPLSGLIAFVASRTVAIYLLKQES